MPAVNTLATFAVLPKVTPDNQYSSSKPVRFEDGEPKYDALSSNETLFVDGKIENNTPSSWIGFRGRSGPGDRGPRPRDEV